MHAAGESEILAFQKSMLPAVGNVGSAPGRTAKA